MTSSARPLLNRRLAGFGTTIFAEMSALACAPAPSTWARASRTPTAPRRSGRRRCGPCGTAAATSTRPAPASPTLRTAIAAHQQRRYGLSVDPDTEVLVTAGATEAIAASLLALLEPGDEVVALEPYYDSYAACVAMAGATRVPVTLRHREGRFHLDLDELRARRRRARVPPESRGSRSVWRPPGGPSPPAPVWVTWSVVARFLRTAICVWAVSPRRSSRPSCCNWWRRSG
ncbi:Histidinol-phosphate aminotransferase [Streptomyces hirsutus]